MAWTWSGFPMTRKKLLLLLFFFTAAAGLSGGQRFLGFFGDDPLPTPSSHQLHVVHDDAPAPAPAHAHARARSISDGDGGLNSFIHYWFPRQPHSSRVWPVRNIPPPPPNPFISYFPSTNSNQLLYICVYIYFLLSFFAFMYRS